MKEKDGAKKSRRDSRKEARMAKGKKKFDSWIDRQQSLKLKNKSKSKSKSKAKNAGIEQPQVEELHINAKDSKTEGNRGIVNPKIKVKKMERKKGSTKSSGSNFSKYLNMEMESKMLLSAEEDLRLERRLAKKLKVKNKDMDVLLQEILPGEPDEIAQFSKINENSASHGRTDKKGSLDEDSEEEESADDADELDDEILADESDGFDDEISADDADEFDDESSADDADELDEEISADDADDLDDENSADKTYVDSDSPVASSEEETILPEDSNKRKRRKLKFEVQGGNNLAEADFALERNDRKKLKVNEGHVRGEVDDMPEGIPSVLQNPSLSEQEQVEQEMNSDTGATGSVETSPSEVSLKNPPNLAPAKYVAPHLRSSVGNESEQHAQVRKRVRGLLNRLSETNVESITGEISALSHSVGRGIGSQIVIEEVVASCSGGPRGNEQYAAIFAAFVAGMACLVGVDFGAKLLARLAKCFEEEYLKEDNLSLRNLTLLLSFLYNFGVCSSELLYDFLIMLSTRLTEVDVSTVLTVLQCCGMKLRGDDPVGMKNFISSVQSRVNELKASSGDGQSNMSSKRMEFMLETIFDIKNNRKRSAEDTPQHTRIKKWLQKLRVVDILIRGLKWSKLLDPHKKGQWWLSGDMASATENIVEVAGTIDREITETKKMLQLAAAQRMNTDARRAIFCVIMSGEDYLDAFEKLLRLDLQGKQDREIMRVLVDCCLQEKVFNKYYSVLASKLCTYDKNHKFTLQYCLWDHFKDLESMPLMKSMHLSKFTAEMVASFSLSLAVLKAVDFNDPSQLTPKRIMHFRMLFEAIFEFPDKRVWNIFTRLAITPEHESLRSGIEFFIRTYVVTSQNALGTKFKFARKALNNVDGVLL